jgi:hypothetical protein
MHAFLDATKPLTTNYGAVVGLSALGAQVCVVVLLLWVAAHLLLCVLRCGHTYRPALLGLPSLHAEAAIWSSRRELLEKEKGKKAAHKA